MKKLQTYLLQGELARKKAQNSQLRTQLCQSKGREGKEPLVRGYRSKSPSHHSKSSSLVEKRQKQSMSKENLRYSNNCLSSRKLQNQNTSAHTHTTKPYLSHSVDNSKKVLLSCKPGPGNLNPSKRIAKTNHNRSIGRKEPIHNRSATLLSHGSRKVCSQATSNPKWMVHSANSSVMEPPFESQTSIKLRYSYRTRQGILITNPAKTNQDSLYAHSYTSLLDQPPSVINHLFAIADGHGAFGHLVSQLIVKELPKLLEIEIQKKVVNLALPKVYELLQKELTDSTINVSCSGSTLVTVAIENNILTCANVGDSRAILARQSTQFRYSVERKSWEMIHLSQDHKPSLQSERKRILKQGGRVHAFKDEDGQPVGPLRVWLPNQNIQGLAMTRSLGDNVSKSVGVTYQPEIIRLQLDVRDRFILIASDGVWEFISNQEVLQLIVPFYRENKLQEACDALLKLAYQRWTVEDTSVVDDITFVLVFFNS